MITIFTAISRIASDTFTLISYIIICATVLANIYILGCLYYSRAGCLYCSRAGCFSLN